MAAGSVLTGVMTTTLEGAGFKVVIATVDGQAIGGKHILIMPDLNKGVMVPCLNAAATSVESIQVVKDALAAGLPEAKP